MSSAARTVHLFGLYLVAVGLIVVALPNVLLGVLGAPSTDEPWIRILGLVVLVLAAYYLVAARNELTAFFRATVAGRVFVGTGVIVIVAVWGYWPAVAIGVVDIAAALWTRAALRRDVGRSPSASEPPQPTAP